MSSLYSYLHSWIYSSYPSGQQSDIDVPQAPSLACVSSAHASVSDSITIPFPARNMPSMEVFRLHALNKTHLDAIMNVKLRHVEVLPTTRVYSPKHPVLKELLEKTRYLQYVN